MLGTDGNFYGTTSEGGALGACNEVCGTVFKITPQGTLTTLHSFVGYPTDGDYPMGPLIQATDGNFYGTTFGGGANQFCGFGCGTVLKITPMGATTTLYSFNDEDDGAYPYGGLVQATDGNSYGTAHCRRAV